MGAPGRAGRSREGPATGISGNTNAYPASHYLPKKANQNNSYFGDEKGSRAYPPFFENIDLRPG
jgi:hypothetical protein